LAISLETALAQAAAYGHTLQMEVKILILHGLLHLAGYDHEHDQGQMRRRETRLRKQFALPAGLVERNQRARRTAKP
jgi:probable rRNA maturation factor